MALIVEDGTGLADAESYISVAAFKAYCDAYGLSYAGKTDTEIEQALRRATEWLDATYGGRWTDGNRLAIGQALIWPLSGLVDRYGHAIPYLPKRLLSATAEAAVRELATPNSLAPDVVPGKVKKRLKVGEVEFEYAIGNGGAQSQQPVVSVIDGILAPLFRYETASYSGRAVRA